MTTEPRPRGRPPKPHALTVQVSFKTTDRGSRVLDALVDHCRTQPGYDSDLTQADLLRILIRDRYRDAVKYEGLAEVQ